MTMDIGPGLPPFEPPAIGAAFDATELAVVPAGGLGEEILCVLFLPTRELARPPADDADPPAPTADEPAFPTPVTETEEGTVPDVAGRERERERDELLRTAPELGGTPFVARWAEVLTPTPGLRGCIPPGTAIADEAPEPTGGNGS